ncbi:MAG: hypothetical protein WB543_12315 [Candidatus Acidiferrum sp.]
MPNQVSAIDAISPAFARMWQLLFRPFRFGLWARLAVVALVTGETSGGGGASVPNFNSNRGGENHWAGLAHLFREPGWVQIQPYLFWIVLAALAILGLILLWIYSDCVYRFILLESVISGECRLREGWRRWKETGVQYFYWVLVYAFSALVGVGVLIGVPVLLAFRAGWFEKSDEHIWALIGGGFLLAIAVVALVAVLGVVDVLGRDFLVPLMAFEDVGPVDGWRQLLSMVGAEKLSFSAYVVMKIVLAVGSAIVFTIVNLIVILILLIPLTLLGVAGFFASKTAGITWDTSAVLLVAAFAMLA